MSVLQYKLDLGGGGLLQMSNKSPSQMMSYIIDCPDKGTIVIDGGMYCDEDADYLYEQLSKREKKVDFWFFSHCHADHYGAWLKLVERGNFDIEIGKLCFNFPDREWLFKKEDLKWTKAFFEVIDKGDFNIVTPKFSDVFSCGGVDIEILNHPINYENYRSINPTGIILKAHFPKRKILFLGDYDIDAEKDFRENFPVEKLRCDIVQMAHHGQDGVSRDFYELISPKYCLYTAPDWLWENNIGHNGGPDTRGNGPFKTMETRKWMAEMKVVRSFHLGEGDWYFK